MKTLVEYLLESSEAQRELKTYDEAAEYFKEKYGDEDRWPIDADALKRAYEKAKSKHKLPVILLKEGGWCLRRWIQVDIETLNDLNLDEKKAEDVLDRGNKTNKFRFFRGFRNGSIAKEFPSSSEMEIILAVSLSARAADKNMTERDLVEMISFALTGKDHVDDKDEKTIAKYMDYFSTRCGGLDGSIDFDRIRDITNGAQIEKNSYRYRKLFNKEVKVRSEYTANGMKPANNTPKTDIVGVDKSGKITERISIKKASGAQAMSGVLNETKMTILAYGHYLSDEDRNELDKIFAIDWSGRDSTRNKAITEKFVSILKKRENKDFVKAILKEALTGAAKFGKDSPAYPDKMLTWDDNMVHMEDVDDYVEKLYKYTMKDVAGVFTINHKTSRNNTNAALRIDIPSINKL